MAEPVPPVGSSAAPSPDVSEEIPDAKSNAASGGRMNAETVTIYSASAFSERRPSGLFPRNAKKEKQFQVRKDTLTMYGERMKLYGYWYYNFDADVIGGDAHAEYMQLPAVQKLGPALQKAFSGKYGWSATNNYEFANNVCRNSIFHVEEGLEEEWKPVRAELYSWARLQKKEECSRAGARRFVLRFSERQLDGVQPRDLMALCILETFPDFCDNVFRVERLFSRLGVSIKDECGNSQLHKVGVFMFAGSLCRIGWL